MPKRALVLGGTGMLAGVAGHLVNEGWLVVLPSRRYSPLPDYAEPGRGRALWVQARWERPERLVRDTADALDGPADLLVAWVHNEYRRSVLNAVEPLLVPDAPVVEVFDAPPDDRFGAGPDPTLPEHPTQQVLLGYVRDGDRMRWLTHTEIVDGVLDAVKRAIRGAPTTEHYVGQARAWTH